MKQINRDKIDRWMNTHARPLELEYYNYYFKSDSVDKIYKALNCYQNDDGGFGNAIEPDLRLPYSTPLATSVAFQYLESTDAGFENDLVKKGMDFFLNSYASSIHGWQIICSESDNYPHAPWWDYRRSLQNFDWGNPSAEILGYIIKYAENRLDLIECLTSEAITRLHEIETPEFHELLNFKRLYEIADERLKAQLHTPLARLIKQAVVSDPTKWNSYVAKPLTFINSPEDPFAELFTQELLYDNIEHLSSTITEESYWEPSWNWGNNYPEDWVEAKREWSGILTVNNMILLKNFKIIS